jgi:hypothetical protein
MWRMSWTFSIKFSTHRKMTTEKESKLFVEAKVFERKCP